MSDPRDLPRNGGPPCWTGLRQFLLRMFEQLGLREHDAEDLAHESLARVLRRTDGATLPVSLGLAATVGRNLWRDRIRQRVRRGETGIDAAIPDLVSPAPAPADVASDREDSARLRAALEALDPRHRRAITLVVLQHTSYADAARILGVPRGTVKSRVHYGIERLRALLSERVSVPENRERPC